MSINLKAKETLIQVGELKGKYRFVLSFVLSTELYSKLPERPLRSYPWSGNHAIRRARQECGYRG